MMAHAYDETAGEARVRALDDDLVLIRRIVVVVVVVARAIDFVMARDPVPLIAIPPPFTRHPDVAGHRVVVLHDDRRALVVVSIGVMDHRALVRPIEPASELEPIARDVDRAADIGLPVVPAVVGAVAMAVIGSVTTMTI